MSPSVGHTGPTARWLRAMGVEMQTHEFRRLMGLLDTLSADQRAQLQLQLTAGGGARSVSAIIEARAASGLCCPRCGAAHVVRNGHADGLQRYKCRGCGRTFNALAGTPLARLRHREKWLAQANALDAGLSVRKAALRMTVHRTTAFRWRHRFLKLASTRRATALAGVAEADETYTLRSYKGQRRRLRAEQARAPRRRGGKRASGACRTSRCRLWYCVTVPGKRRISSWIVAMLATSSRYLPGPWPKMRSCVPTPAPHWPRPRKTGASSITPSTARGVSAVAVRGISRTSMPITAATRPGCVVSTVSPPRICKITSAGSAPSTAMPKAARHPHRCLRWRSTHDSVHS